MGVTAPALQRPLAASIFDQDTRPSPAHWWDHQRKQWCVDDERATFTRAPLRTSTCVYCRMPLAASGGCEDGCGGPQS